MSKVDGSSGSERSWVKVDDLLTESGRSRGKVNGLSETLTLMRNYPNPNVKLLQPEFVSNPYPNFELP